MNFFGWDVVKKVLMVESLPVLFLRAGPGASEKNPEPKDRLRNTERYKFFLN